MIIYINIFLFESHSGIKMEKGVYLLINFFSPIRSFYSKKGAKNSTSRVESGPKSTCQFFYRLTVHQNRLIAWFGINIYIYLYYANG